MTESTTEVDQLELLPTTPLLTTESSAEHEAIRQAIELELRPASMIERIYVADFIDLVWETMRYRRTKTAMINVTLRPALERLLPPLLRTPMDPFSHDDEARDLAQRWFTDALARKRVADLLHQVGLDNHAIEAEAVRQLFSELEALDRMLTSLDVRRSRVLAFLTSYRASLGTRARETSDRMLDGRAIPQIQDRASKRPAA
jgi:hypothetical protein